MTKKQQDYVMGIVDCEGFDYAFCNYSDFKEVKDVEFQEARKVYEEAAKKLKQIIGFSKCY